MHWHHTTLIINMYHQQQNKEYPQRCLLDPFEATLDFNCSEFTCKFLHQWIVKKIYIITYGYVIIGK